MKIITSRKLRFRNGSESFVTEGSNLIQDCPDWVAADLMFAAAQKAGILNVLDTNNRRSRVEESMPVNAHEEKELAEVNEELASEGLKDPVEVDEARAERLARRKARREAKKQQLEEG